MGKKWTNEEKDFFAQNFKKMPVKEIAEKLNRSQTSVYSYSRNANKKLKKKPPNENTSKILKAPIEEKSVNEALIILENALHKEEAQILERLSNLQSYKQLIKK
jgi:DNA-binding CsgD family transcriptional regulator